MKAGIDMLFPLVGWKKGLFFKKEAGILYLSPLDTLYIQGLCCYAVSLLCYASLFGVFLSLNAHKEIFIASSTRESDKGFAIVPSKGQCLEDQYIGWAK